MVCLKFMCILHESVAAAGYQDCLRNAPAYLNEAVTQKTIYYSPESMFCLADKPTIE